MEMVSVRQGRRLPPWAMAWAGWVLILQPPCACAAEIAGVEQRMDHATLRVAIASLDLLNPPERERVIPWLVGAIGRQPDVRVRARLSETLRETLARLTVQAPEGEPQVSWRPGLIEETPAVLKERQQFERAVRSQAQQPVLSEDAIRRKIETLTLDPTQPEVALNQAMELGGVINRLEDVETRKTLRVFLGDRLEVLQADLPEPDPPSSEDSSEDIFVDDSVVQ